VFTIEPVDFYCRHCDSAMEIVACDEPYCPGWHCMLCGAGTSSPACDWERILTATGGMAGECE
jgi:hypothetical protein